MLKKLPDKLEEELFDHGKLGTQWKIGDTMENWGHNGKLAQWKIGRKLVEENWGHIPVEEN